MNNSAIANIRLANQQLLPESKCRTPSELVSFMGLIQAQDFSMAKWALGIRISGSTNSSIEDAYTKGEILRTHILRPTWHFVASENIRWMLPLTAAKIASSMKARDRDLELTEACYIKGLKIIEKALADNNHLTREELTTVFYAKRFPVNTSQLYHLMMRAELYGLVCSGILKGKKHTYALLDERVPATKSLNREEALAKLALLYFTARWPASLQDFVWWSGLSSTEAKQGIEALKKDFVCEKIDTQDYWIANTFRESSHNSPFHLLPAFDEYIIAYKDRSAVLPTAHHAKAISSNGVFRPTIVHNGQVVGLWKKTTSKNNPIALNFFQKNNKINTDLSDKAIKEFQLFLLEH